MTDTSLRMLNAQFSAAYIRQNSCQAKTPHTSLYQYLQLPVYTLPVKSEECHEPKLTTEAVVLQAQLQVLARCYATPASRECSCKPQSVSEYAYDEGVQ
jgi:hypothetical protein